MDIKDDFKLDAFTWNFWNSHLLIDSSNNWRFLWVFISVNNVKVSEIENCVQVHPISLVLKPFWSNLHTAQHQLIRNFNKTVGEKGPIMYAAMHKCGGYVDNGRAHGGNRRVGPPRKMSTYAAPWIRWSWLFYVKQTIDYIVVGIAKGILSNVQLCTYLCIATRKTF